MAVSRWRRFAAKLSGLFGRRRAELDSDEEMRMHLQLLTEQGIRRGMNQEEAARAARRQFGNLSLLQQNQRELRSVVSLANLGRDLRFGARQLRRSPSLTAIAVISLALGIGANTAIFTVARKVLLDTLPVKNPHALRLLTWVSGHEQPVPPVWGDVGATESGGLRSTAFSYPVLEELRKKTDVFRDLIAFKDIQMTVTVDGSPDLAQGEMVSGNALSALGVDPLLGRLISPADDAGPGTGPVAVVSEGYWAERFGRSSSVIGRTIFINGVPVTVVGVVPARFSGLQMGEQTQVFVPLTMQPLLAPREQLIGSGSASLLNNPESWWVLILARLRPDVSEAQTQAALDVVLRQTAMAGLPPTKGMEQFHLQLEKGDRGLDYLTGEFAKPSYVLLTLAGLVLLLACVNLANLLLARAATRQREISTRLALGASRMHILRQMLTESLLLSILGGAVGLLLGYLGRNAIPRLLSAPWEPARMQVNFDWLALSVTLGLSLATGILFGIVPAWQATRTEVNTAPEDTGHATAGRHRMWLGKGLVIFQIALSTVLLIGAGLFVRTLANLGHRPLGFRTDHILLFRLSPPRSRYPDANMVVLYRQLEEMLAAIPGVQSVAMSNIAIVGDGHSGSTFHRSGTPTSKNEKPVQTNGVGADFFRTMGIPVLAGRSFNARDTATTPRVALVNQALVRQFYPHEDPIGQTFDTDADEAGGPVQIVGVVADTRYADLRSETPPTFYVPYQQRPRSGRMMVELRTAAEPGSVLSQVRRVVESVDRDLPLIGVRTMTEQVQATMSGERIFAQLTSGFGILALVLACIGIYGITAYTVARRTSEIGIRMALGAQAAQVLGMVLREVSWLALAGVTVGVGCALWLARFLRTMLYGLQPSDPLTLTSAAALLIIIALVAGFGPARRASRVDPVSSLRHE
jgi:predicted permease